MFLKNLYYRFILFMIIVMACPALVQAGEHSTKRYVLDNGMVVLISELPMSPTVSVYALVKTGSATEGKYLGTGISHFVEHMLFKGTQKRPMGAISSEVKALGGTINASTSFDQTMYTLDVPKQSMTYAVDIISDMIMNSVFDPVEVTKEREVIFGEMRMINDRPERKLADLVYQNVFTRHPYHHPIIGYVPLFGTIKQDELVEYYHSKYVPNNIVLSVAGAVKPEEVISLIKETFKNFQPKPYSDRNLSVEPPQNFFRRVEQEYPSETYRFSMAYQGVGLFDLDMYALDVLAMALGQGESSRLYLDVFKARNLVDQIDASNYTPLDPGVFEINAETSRNTVEKAIAAIKQNLDIIKKNGIRPAELEKTKHQVLSSNIFSRQTSPAVAYKTAIDEAMTGDYAFEDKYLNEIRRVSNEDIKRVANKYFMDQHLTVVVLKPQDKGNHQKNENAQSSIGEIKKEVLPNGLTILIMEDHTFPIVSMNVLVNAGLRQEPEQLRGLSYLTADLWIKGTAKRSAQDIAEITEAKGASLTSFSGYNSMGIRLDVLSEDMTFALDVIEDCVKNPVFSESEMKQQIEANIADLKRQQDSIFDVTMQSLREVMFLTHPFRFTLLGTVDSLSLIQRKDVIDFYRKHFSASNMVIAVYGDVKPEQVFNELRKRFGELPAKQVKIQKFDEGFPTEAHEKILSMDKEQAALMIGYQAPNMFDQDRYTMEVISSIFGSSLSGRMFVKIREELGKAYTLGASYSPSIDQGMIYFYVLTTDEQVEKVKAILLSEIQSIVELPISEKELSVTKSNLKGRFAMNLDTVGELAITNGFDELYGLGYAQYKTYDENIDRITVQDVQRVARKYLDPKYVSIVVTRPSKK